MPNAARSVGLDERHRSRVGLSKGDLGGCGAGRHNGRTFQVLKASESAYLALQISGRVHSGSRQRVLRLIKEFDIENCVVYASDPATLWPYRLPITRPWRGALVER